MKLEFKVDIYESIFSNEPAVQVLKTGDIYSGYEDGALIMYRELDTEEWYVMSKKEFLKHHKKVS